MAALRTFKNAYLSMVFKGDRAPAGAAAAKKGPPSGTHESLGVLEHVRTHETTVLLSLLYYWYIVQVLFIGARHPGRPDPPILP